MKHLTSELLNLIKGKAVSFSATDGYNLSGDLYLAPAETASDQFLLIGSALGVRKHYYRHFAHYLAEQGIHCLCFDYRGIGESSEGCVEPEAMKLQHWAELDISAAIDAIQNSLTTEYKLPKDLQLHYLGHSASGQILGLSPNAANTFKSITLAGSGLGNWHHWQGLQRYFLYAMWNFVFPTLLKFTHKPRLQSRLLGKVPIPTSVLKQWLAWAGDEDYLFNPKHRLDISQYAQFDCPLLALSVTDDFYAPKTSLDALLSHYSNAKISHVRVAPESIGLKKIGHFGIFKKKEAITNALWQPMANFILEQKDVTNR